MRYSKIVVLVFVGLVTVFLWSGLTLTERGGLDDGITDPNDPYHQMNEYADIHFDGTKGIWLFKRFPEGIDADALAEMGELHTKLARDLPAFTVWSPVNHKCFGVQDKTLIAHNCTDTSGELFREDGGFSLPKWKREITQSSTYGMLVARDFTHIGMVLYPPKGANQIDLFYQVKASLEDVGVHKMGFWEKLTWSLETDIYPADESVLVGGWIIARGLIDTSLTVDMFTLITVGVLLSGLLLWVVTGSLRQALLGVGVVVAPNILFTWGEIGVIDLFWSIKMRVYILLAFANAILQGLSFSLVLFTVYNRIRRSKDMPRTWAWKETRRNQGMPLGLIAAISFSGFVTLWPAFEVVAIRELAVMSAMGVLNLVFLALVVLPAAHKYVGGEGKSVSAAPLLERGYVKIADACGFVTTRTPAWFVLCLLVLLAGITAGNLVQGKLEVRTQPLSFLTGTIIDRTAQYANAPHRPGFDTMEMYVENRNGEGVTDVAFAKQVTDFAADVSHMDGVRRVRSVYSDVPHIYQELYQTDALFPKNDGELQYIFQGAIGLNSRDVRDQWYDENGVRVGASMAMDDMRALLAICEEVREAAQAYSRIRIAILGDICQYPQTDVQIVEGKPINAVLGQLTVMVFAFGFVLALLKTVRFARRAAVSIATGIVMGIPFAFATCAIFLVMMQFGIPLDVATASISALAINATTDFTIHFVDSYLWFRQRGYGHAAALFRAYKDKGSVVFGDMVQNALCFSILMVSQFAPIQMLGLLMTVMVVFAGIGTLLVMPPLLRWAYR